jgi:hypothetical protein
MWTESDIKKLWYRIICDLRLKHPKWMELMKTSGYKAIVVNKKANYFGQCDYRKKTVCINLHLHKNSSEEQIVDTMLHEIAHALDYLVDGKSSGHGTHWKSISGQLGNTPKAKSKSAKGVEYPYVMCLHDLDNKILEFARGYNRKPSRTPIGRFIMGTWLKSDKEGTMDKIIVYKWKDWCKVCDQYGKGYFREDHL